MRITLTIENQQDIRGAIKTLTGIYFSNAADEAFPDPVEELTPETQPVYQEAPAEPEPKPASSNELDEETARDKAREIVTELIAAGRQDDAVKALREAGAPSVTSCPADHLPALLKALEAARNDA